MEDVFNSREMVDEGEVEEYDADAAYGVCAGEKVCGVEVAYEGAEMEG